MFYKLYDKFLEKIKYFLSIITFLFIVLATYFFIYWLIFSANLRLTDALETFTWGIIDFVVLPIKHTKVYSEMTPVLPVITCTVFILSTYVINSVIDILDSYSKILKDCSIKSRLKLEKKINAELHKSFIDELKVYKYLILNFKISVTKMESYLSALNQDTIDTDSLEMSIQNKILASISSPFIVKKQLDNGAATFLVSDFTHAKDVISDIVGKSVSIITHEMRDKIDIHFYCAADLLKESDYPSFSLKNTSKILSSKIKNKIVVTPRLKVYFENVLPTEFNFSVAGEYNMSDDPDLLQNEMLYFITRK